MYSVKVPEVEFKPLTHSDSVKLRGGDPRRRESMVFRGDDPELYALHATMSRVNLTTAGAAKSRISGKAAPRRLRRIWPSSRLFSASRAAPRRTPQAHPSRRRRPSQRERPKQVPRGRARVSRRRALRRHGRPEVPGQPSRAPARLSQQARPGLGPRKPSAFPRPVAPTQRRLDPHRTLRPRGQHHNSIQRHKQHSRGRRMPSQHHSSQRRHSSRRSRCSPCAFLSERPARRPRLRRRPPRELLSAHRHPSPSPNQSSRCPTSPRKCGRSMRSSDHVYCHTLSFAAACD